MRQYAIPSTGKVRFTGNVAEQGDNPDGIVGLPKGQTADVRFRESNEPSWARSEEIVSPSAKVNDGRLVSRHGSRMS